MKRDFDLIRRMMRDIEAVPAGQSVGIPNYDDVDRPTVVEHAVLLLEAGLIKGRTQASMNSPLRMSITGLTWEGHEFLAVAKDDTIWEKGMKSVLGPAASTTWTFALEWLKAEAMKKFTGG